MGNRIVFSTLLAKRCASVCFTSMQSGTAVRIPKCFWFLPPSRRILELSSGLALGFIGAAAASA
eukprot:645166-Lingulodinium_polyedra.AAC.1